MCCVTNWSPQHAAFALLQIALRAIVGSIAHDDSLVAEVREAFEELEHGRTGSVRNSILLQVLPWHTTLLRIQSHCDISEVLSVGVHSCQHTVSAYSLNVILV